MQVDEVAKSGRKKTGLPNELAASLNQVHEPNIIHEERKDFIPMPPSSSSNSNRISMRDIEQHASTKEELYSLLSVQGKITIESNALIYDRATLSPAIETMLSGSHEISPKWVYSCVLEP